MFVLSTANDLWTVILETDQTLTDDERMALDETLEDVFHLLARFGAVPR